MYMAAVIFNNSFSVHGAPVQPYSGPSRDLTMLKKKKLTPKYFITANINDFIVIWENITVSRRHNVDFHSRWTVAQTGEGVINTVM